MPIQMMICDSDIGDPGRKREEIEKKDRMSNPMLVEQD